jgi:iron complex transport system substrate-binding protein
VLRSIRKSVPKALTIAFACVAFSATALRAQTSVPGVPPAVETREIVDETGRTLRVPVSIERIVSLAPSLTETIYALGLQDRLVGDTDYCDYPPDALKKAKVGGAVNPNFEKIAALRPDLVLVTKSINRLDTVRALDTLGIPSYATDPHTVDEIISSTEKLATVLGAPDTGKSLGEDMVRRLAVLQTRLKDVQPIHCVDGAVDLHWERHFYCRRAAQGRSDLYRRLGKGLATDQFGRSRAVAA